MEHEARPVHDPQVDSFVVGHRLAAHVTALVRVIAELAEQGEQSRILAVREMCEDLVLMWTTRLSELDRGAGAQGSDEVQDTSLEQYGHVGAAVTSKSPGARRKKKKMVRGIAKASIRKIARRGGCERTASSVARSSEALARSFVDNLERDADSVRSAYPPPPGHAFLGVQWSNGSPASP